MEYRNFGRTGIRVSALCLGAMTFGWQIGEALSHQLLDAFMDAGGNFIDTADVYSRWHPGNRGGESETIIGQWFAARPEMRARVVLATKVRGGMGEGLNEQGLSRKHICDAIDASLRRLQTDYVDLYQMHAPDPLTALEESVETLNDLVRQGKVRYWGISNFPAWQTCRLLWLSEQHGWARCVSTQPHYNLMWRAEFERELQALCAEFRIAVIPYSPLAGGFLTGKYRQGQGAPAGSRGETSPRVQGYFTPQGFAVVEALDQLAAAHQATPSQIALAWVLANPVITAPIIGATAVPQLQETLGALAIQLSPAEKQQLDTLTQWNS